jgi:hypothetical protein
LEAVVRQYCRVGDDVLGSIGGRFGARDLGVYTVFGRLRSYFETSSSLYSASPGAGGSTSVVQSILSSSNLPLISYPSYVRAASVSAVFSSAKRTITCDRNQLFGATIEAVQLAEKTTSSPAICSICKLIFARRRRRREIGVDIHYPI